MKELRRYRERYMYTKLNYQNKLNVFLGVLPYDITDGVVGSTVRRIITLRVLEISL
jgi:hypothetical protein